MTALLVCAGAALGAPSRYLLGLLWDTDSFPWGIWSVNVSGSLLLGVLVGVDLGDPAMALVGTGFCGAFTTYSSFAVGSFERGLRRGALYAILTVGVAIPACALGFWVGAAWT